MLLPDVGLLAITFKRSGNTRWISTADQSGTMSQRAREMSASVPPRIYASKRREHSSPLDPLYFSFLFSFRATLPFLVVSLARPFPHVGLFAMTSDSVRCARRNIIVTFTQIAARCSRLIRTGLAALPLPGPHESV